MIEDSVPDGKRELATIYMRVLGYVSEENNRGEIIYYRHQPYKNLTV